MGKISQVVDLQGVSRPLEKLTFLTPLRTYVLVSGGKKC